MSNTVDLSSRRLEDVESVRRLWRGGGKWDGTLPKAQHERDPPTGGGPRTLTQNRNGGWSSGPERGWSTTKRTDNEASGSGRDVPPQWSGPITTTPESGSMEDCLVTDCPVPAWGVGD